MAEMLPSFSESTRWMCSHSSRSTDIGPALTSSSITTSVALKAFRMLSTSAGLARYWVAPSLIASTVVAMLA